jgi:hypothetical protein
MERGLPQVNDNATVVPDAVRIDRCFYELQTRCEHDVTLEKVAEHGGCNTRKLRRAREGQRIVFLNLRRIVRGLQHFGQFDPPLDPHDFIATGDGAADPRPLAPAPQLSATETGAEVTALPISNGRAIVDGRDRTSSPPEIVSSGTEREARLAALAPSGLTAAEAPAPLKPQSAPWRVPQIAAVVGVVCLIALAASWIKDVVTRVPSSPNAHSAASYNAPGQLKDLSSLSHHLTDFDPAIFNGKGDEGVYELARLIPDRPTLRGETSFTEDVKTTVHSFDMLANTAGVIREEWLPVVIDGLRRGVHYRLILSDYRKSNPHFDAFSHAVGEDGTLAARGALHEHHRQLAALFNRLEADSERGSEREFRGKLQVRWNPELLLYTMWLRDPATPDGVAHLGIHFYQGKDKWPYLRASRRSAPATLDNMIVEFETAWDRSLPFETIPYDPAQAEGAGAQ